MPSKRKRGRPSKIDEPLMMLDGTETTIADYIVDAISRGAYAHVAAAAAGIAPKTFRGWMEKGTHDDTPPAYRDFRTAVLRARGKARISAETRVHDTDPAKWLKAGPGRDKPEEEGWAETSKYEHTGAGGGPMQVGPPIDLKRLTPTELRTLHELTAKAESGE